MYCYGFLWFLTIQKWLIKARGHIPILLGAFWNFNQLHQKMDLCTPYLSQKYFKKYKKFPNPFQQISVFISQQFGNSESSTYWEIHHTFRELCLRKMIVEEIFENSF